jgi:hypothetical protein
MDRILELSRREYKQNISNLAGPSRSTPSTSAPLFDDRELRENIDSISSEISELDDQITKLTTLRDLRDQERHQLLKQFQEQERRRSDNVSLVGNAAGDTNRWSRGPNASREIDYATDWEWSAQMRKTMKDFFGIDEFRLCQKRFVKIWHIECLSSCRDLNQRM